MFEQFPTIQFKVKHVAVSNLFDLTGNNVVTVNWEVHVVNRDGVEAYNRGVAVISIKKGKLVHLQEYIFDTGAQFCAAWGEGA
jgi:ketosteroid isomerase-like protein